VDSNPFINPNDETVREINAGQETRNLANKMIFIAYYVQMSHPGVYTEALQAWHALKERKEG
jgi:hypothetical protein